MADVFSQTGAFVNQTLASAFNPATSVYGADLYTGTNVDSLNVFEKAWMQWYMYWGNPVIATGIMSFLLHEIIYFGRAIPFMIVDSMPSMRKYKIQEDKVATPELQWKCTKYVLLTHFTVELPQIWSFHPICEFFELSTHSVPFPSWKTIAWQIGIFFLFEDFFHYWAHRALHWGPLYKNIHKKHHEFSAPFGLAAEYAHPLEVLILGAGTVGGPFLLCYFTRNLHIITVYIWITLRLFQAIDAHSGYDFPFSMHNWVPFWAGADHHDHHHMAFVGCYSTSFRWWDHLMGTDLSYKRYRARQAAQKKEAKEKGLSWPVNAPTKTSNGQLLKAKAE